jgi:SSS family solute:Na+ symporter
MNLGYRDVCLFLVLLFLIFAGCSAPEDRVVSGELRQEALEQLQSVLRSGQKWEKVHAAECLLDLGYSQDITDIFREEETLSGTEYYYRIGIWRVLARAAASPAEKQKWVDSVSSVFSKPELPDHLHATESLAKLGISPYRVSPSIADSILNSSHNSLWLYVLWGKAYSGEEEMNQVKSKLLDIVCSKKETDTIRRLAAYALRNMKNINDEQWSALADAACNEPDTSRAYTYILSSAFVNTPADSLVSPLAVYCKEALLNELSNSGKPENYEALFALAEKGVDEDLPLLTSLVREETAAMYKNKEDIAVAASNAILRIDRRQKYTLHGIDWGVIVLYGIGMLLVGFYYSRKARNTEDYLLGGRTMRPFAVGLSLFATMVSSLSYLSYPGEMILNGPAFFIGMIIFPLIYYIVGWFLIPKFMEMKATSAYELLEKRLGLGVRMLATFFFLTLRFLWMATIIYATINTALVAIVDIPPSYAPYISVFLMLLTITYTSLGGFKAVVTTDVIQSIVLWSGAFLTIFVVSMHFNSLTAWLPDHYLEHWSPLKWGADVQQRTTIGNAMVMLLVWFICTNGSDQMAVQRYLSTKDLRAARHTFGISLIATFVVKIFLAVVGLAMIAYFTANPHFLDDGQSITGQADRLFPKFILIGLPVGISGLVASGIFAAAMSSLSSGLNSSSSVINEDILKRLTPRLVSANPLRQVKKISVLVGIIAILLSLVIGNVQGNLLDVVVKVVNLLVAPLFVLFFMAIFVPFATSKGTIIGGLASVAMAIVAAFWQFMGITVLWIMPSALFVGIVVGVIASLSEKLIRSLSR